MPKDRNYSISEAVEPSLSERQSKSKVGFTLPAGRKANLTLTLKHADPLLVSLPTNDLCLKAYLSLPLPRITVFLL